MAKPHDYLRAEHGKARGRLAAAVRTRPPGDPAIDRARRAFAAVKARAFLHAAMAELKEAAPDMTHPLQLCQDANDEIARSVDADGI